MSDGLKTALIIGGAGVAGYLIWKNSQAGTAGSISTTTGTAFTSSGAPGAPLPPAPPPMANGAVAGGIALGTTSGTSSGGGGGSSSTLKKIGVLAAAPIVVPTVLAVKGAEAIGSGVVSAGKSIGGAASSVFHSVSSWF